MVCGTVSDILRQPYRSGLRDRPTVGQAQLVGDLVWGKLREVREVREVREKLRDKCPTSYGKGYCLFTSLTTVGSGNFFNFNQFPQLRNLN